MINSNLKRKFRQLLKKVFSIFPKGRKNNDNGLFRRNESLKFIAEKTKDLQVKEDHKIVSRIIKAYKLAAISQKSLGNSMWQTFFDQRHLPLHNIFMGEQIDISANILRNPGSSDLFYGFDNLMLPFQSQVSTNASERKNHAAVCLDALVRFAEAIGAVRLDNPEQYHAGPAIPWDADTIIQNIERKLGQKISFPNPYPDEHGVLSSKGVISYRVSQALYQSYRIKELLKNVKSPRVLEIGAGLGRTAYYTRELGIEDYTIIDIPFTLNSSGYFLSRTLGEDKVQFYGEKFPNSQQRIKFFPPEEFFNGDNKYDLIINADSLPEMDPNITKAYWNKIQKSTSIFLSINHESHSLSLSELINQSDQVVNSERMPYWMRRGYVDEVVRF